MVFGGNAAWQVHGCRDHRPGASTHPLSPQPGRPQARAGTQRDVTAAMGNPKAESRKPRVESRESRTENREQRTASENRKPESRERRTGTGERGGETTGPETAEGRQRRGERKEQTNGADQQSKPTETRGGRPSLKTASRQCLDIASHSPSLPRPLSRHPRATRNSRRLRSHGLARPLRSWPAAAAAPGDQQGPLQLDMMPSQPGLALDLDHLGQPAPAGTQKPAGRCGARARG